MRHRAMVALAIAIAIGVGGCASKTASVPETPQQPHVTTPAATDAVVNAIPAAKAADRAVDQINGKTQGTQDAVPSD